MSVYDAIIVGGGHNGLVCACYLAKAGLKTLVLERRSIIGGAVCTQTDLIPGYKIDVGSSVHIMIHMTPILRELELEKYGLEYIEMDPWAYYPVPGTNSGIRFHRDLDATCQSIAQFSTHDAEQYRKFVVLWKELNEGIFETFLMPPNPGKIFWTIFKRTIKNFKTRQIWSSMDTSRQLMAPYGQLLDEWFESKELKTALGWLSAQSGPAPTEMASGDMLGWNSMIHLSGAKRAKGGSGALTQALSKRLLAEGGEIKLDAEVSSIEESNGKWNVSLKSGETFEGKKVVSACHIHTLFLDLLKNPPADLKKRVSHTRIGNGFGMMVRHAIEELPQYENKSGIQDYHSAMQLLCPSMDSLQDSHIDFQRGLPPRDPSVVAMTFSAIDPTLAPAGKHTLFTWGQYHPYELRNGEDWDSIREREADKLLERVYQYAPNLRGKVIDRYIQSPLDLERMHGMLRANVMHLEMSLDQMFFFRPLPEIAEYKTPMKGLYLTGASTHPGGGVFGASGYNTAKVVLKEWKK